MFYLIFDLGTGDPFVINNNIPLIPASEISCSDSIDNDEDGLINCADPDCDSSSDCCSPPNVTIGPDN